MGTRGKLPKAGKSHLNVGKGIPLAPDWLSDDARAVYKRTADVLTEKHPAHLQYIDEAVLSVYAASFATVARLEADLQAEGECYQTSTGNIRMHPRVAMRDEAVKRLLQSASKLGFSPIDRQRLSGTLAAPREPDGVDRFLAGNKF